MPIDASIPLQVRPPEFMSPAQAVSLQSLAQQRQMQGMQMQAQMQEMQNKNALRQLLQQSAPDPVTGTYPVETIQKATAFDPRVGIELSNLRASRLAQLGDLAQKQYGAQKEIDQAGVSAYLSMKGKAPEEEAVRSENMAMQAKADEMEKSGLRSAYGFNDQNWNQVRARGFNPSMVGAFIAPKDILAREGKEETPFMREAASLYGKDTPQYRQAVERHVRRMDAPTQTMISLTGQGSLGKPALDLAVDQYLAGDSTAAQGYSRNAQMKSQFMNRLAERAKERGISGTELAARVAEFRGVQAGERALGTRTAQVGMAVAEAQKMIPLALAASESVSRTGIKSINDIEQAAQKATASPELRKFVAANNSLVNVYARAISPTGTPTVSDKEHAREILSTAFSKGDYRAGVEQLEAEMNAAQQSPGTVRDEFRKTVTGQGQSTPGDIKSLVESAGGKYEPDKFEYRIGPSGKVQRRPRG